MRKPICTLGVLVISLLGSLANAGDQATANNPLYATWSKTTVGSSATYAGDIEAPDGTKTHFSGVITLKALTPDGAKIESASKSGDAAQLVEALVVPAKGKSGDVTNKDSATVHAMDKDFNCEVYEINFALAGLGENDKPAEPMTATIYVSSDIPGGVVKWVLHPAHGKSFETIVQSISVK